MNDGSGISEAPATALTEETRNAIIAWLGGGCNALGRFPATLTELNDALKEWSGSSPSAAPNEDFIAWNLHALRVIGEMVGLDTSTPPHEGVLDVVRAVEAFAREWQDKGSRISAKEAEAIIARHNAKEPAPVTPSSAGSGQ